MEFGASNLKIETLYSSIKKIESFEKDIDEEKQLKQIVIEVGDILTKTCIQIKENELN